MKYRGSKQPIGERIAREFSLVKWQTLHLNEELC